MTRTLYILKLDNMLSIFKFEVTIHDFISTLLKLFPLYLDLILTRLLALLSTC